MAGIIRDLTDVKTIILFVLVAALGYFIGSLNLSIVLSKSKGTDIREMGSGNAGATNTYRTMGFSTAVIVFIFDLAKGCLVPLVLIHTAVANPFYFVSTCYSAAYIYAVFAVIGHCFPIYYGFRGGKGIATALGALLVVSPVATLIAIVEFIILFVFFRYISLSSIVAILNVPIFTFLLNLSVIQERERLLAVTIIIAAIAIFKHRANMIRLRDGEESTILYKKKVKK